MMIIFDRSSYINYGVDVISQSSSTNMTIDIILIRIYQIFNNLTRSIISELEG